IDVSRKMFPRIPPYAHHAPGDFSALCGDEKERETRDLSDRITSRLFPLLEFRPSLLSDILPSSCDHRVEHRRIHLPGGNAVHRDPMIPKLLGGSIRQTN